MKPGAIVIVLAAGGLALRLALACHVAALPYQLDYEEGNVLNAGHRIADGVTPYPEPGSFPYVLNPYGPIGYALTALAVKVFGVSLFAPRLFVVLESLALALLVASLVQRLGGLWSCGLVAGFWCLCTPLGWYWIPFLRVDILALTFSLLGLYLFAGRPGVWPAAALACVLLTKHSVLAGVTTCFVTLGADRQWKQALKMLLIVFVIVLAGIAATGGAAPFHLLATHSDPYILTRALKGYVVALTGGLAAVGILVYGWLMAERDAAVPRLAAIFLASSAVISLTGGKLASDVNHFLELTAALAIAAGLVLSRLWTLRDSAAVPLTAGLLVMGFGSIVWHWHQPDDVAKGNQCRQAYDLIRSSNGDRVLSEDVSAVLLSSKPVLLSNPFVYTQIENRLRWSNGTVAQLADQQYFDLIVLGGEAQTFRSESGLWPQSMMTAIAKRYTLAYKFNCSPWLQAIYVRSKTQLEHPGSTPPQAGVPDPR